MANQIKFDVGFNVNKSDLTALTTALRNVQNEVNKANVTGTLTEELKKAGTAASQLESILNQSWNSKLGQLDLSKVNQSVKTTYGSVSQLKQILESSGNSGAAAYNKFASTVLNTNIQLRESNKLISQMAITLGNAFRYGISSRIMNEFVGSIQQAFNYTKKLDTSLNDIRIVTDKSADSMERFARQANDAAKDMGANTLDYTNAALIYYQQGLSDKEVAARTETTIKAANVTGQTGEEVSEQLTAVWNGYKVTAEETETYVDKLAAVAATTAADLEELSTGMSKVASAANAMGVDFDDLNAQIATIVSVTRQAPESVGTALKTIYARLGDLKVDGVDEFGVSLGEVSSQMVQMGIQILDQEGNLRDMSSVIAEVASKWNTWTEAQKQAAAVAMAGKRQYNNLIALFDNWDMYTDALNTSVKAVGTLQHQQDIYMESTAAHLQKLKTESQKTYDILFNQDDVNDFADALTGLLGIFNNFLDAIGGGKEALIALGTLGTRIFSEQIGSGLGDMVLNMERVKANADLDILKQQVINTHMAQGDTISEGAARVEAEMMEKTLAVQKGLNQEQYNELMTIQKQVGLNEEKIRTLEQYADIANEVGIGEQSALSVYQSRLGIEQSELKTRTDIANIINEYLLQAREEELTQRNKIELMSVMRELYQSNLVTSEQINNIGKLDLNTVQGKEQLMLELQEIYNQQNLKVEEQEQLVKRVQLAIEGKTAAENGELQLLRDENVALVNQSEELQRQAEMRQNMQAYVQALSTVVISIQTISSITKTLNDDTLSLNDKIERLFSLALFNLPMLITGLPAIKNAMTGLTVQMGLYATTADAAKVSTLGLGKAIMTTPIGWIVAGLTAIIGVLVLVNKHYEKLREEAKKAADESKENAQTLREEYNSNKDLISQYDELYNQYKKGEIQKEDLWETTNKLIDAYGIEESRISALTGNYDAFTDAINAAREAQKKQLLEQDRDAFKKSGLNVSEQARKGVNDISVSGKILNVGLLSSDDQAINSIYKNIFGTENRSIQIEKDNTLQIINTYEKLLEYQKQLSEVGKENTDEYIQLTNIIEDFNNENAISDLLDLKDKIASDILSFSDLENAVSQIDFDIKLEQLKNDLLEFLPEDEVNEKILSYISTINSSFADSFIIDNEVKKKFGNEINQALLEAFKEYDVQTQAKLLQLHFDLSLDEEEGKKKLQEYTQFITGNQQGIYSIPVSFQDQINDIVLKGKDIAKADWESMTANLPTEALTMLGDREEFNNKSIGERISLLQQVNELVKENNLLAIQQYDKNKEASIEILNDLSQQRESLERSAENWQRWAETTDTPEAFDQANEKILELQKQIEEISRQEYSIKISLDMDVATDNLVQSIVGDVMTEADQMKAAAESIGEGWEVAAEDVATFAAAFPELMEGVERQADGSLQLSKEIVNTELQGAQERINANKQVAIEAAEDKIKQLKLELQFKEEQEKILTEALEGQKTAEETKTALADAAFEYQTQLLDNGLIAEADALTKAQIQEQTGVDGMINILGGLNDAINTIHQNFANMLTVDADMLSLNATAGAVKQITSSSVDTKLLENNGFDTSDITSDIDAMIEARNKLQQEESQIKTQIASYEGFVSEMMNSVSEANKAADRVQQGLAGKEPKSKSSSSKDKDKELKKLEEEFDRYWEIHKALDQIDRDLKRIDKDQENLYGKELIRSLKQENELLANQSQLYEQLYAAQEQEAAELRGTLANSGVVFDASGAIVNYAQATAAALKEYNDAVTAYNNGLLDDAALEIHEQKFEQFKEDLERYDTLFYTEMQDTMEKIDDLRRQTLENNLKAWETEIQLKLDTEELERDWNDFLKEITEDFQSVFKDLRVDLNSMVSDALSYASDDGTINTTIDAIHDVTSEIDKLMNGGTSDMFESVSQAQEKLKELNEQLIDAGQALHDLWEEAWDSYLEGIDQVADKFDDLIDRFETINDELEFQGKLIELLYGDEAYELMSKLYEGQEKSTLNQLESLKTQADMWKDLFYSSGATLENQSSWTEDQKKYYEEWQEAQSSLNDLTIDYIELLQEDYLNTISDILSELEESITGSSLEDINTEWERISANADKYYDSVEGAYYIQTLANKIDQSIASTTSLKAQQKLMELREKEISYLQEKENLTEYDIQAAELRYQIALKEIALEEAQNNKTSMKLTRNEQGNWSYQYVADEDDIATKQQELLDTYNSLYQLASDAYESNLESLQELQETYLESAKEIAADTTLTEEEKQAKLLELRQWYLEQYQILAEENQLYRNDLATSGAGLLLEIYSQDQEAYESMTEYERGLIDALVSANIDDYMDLEEKLKENYQNIGDKAKEVMSETRLDWTSGAQTLADLWNKDNGSSVKSQIVQAYNAIIAANLEYQNKVDQLAITVEKDFSEEGISGAIKGAADETDDLKDKTIEMASESVNYLNDLKIKVNEIEEAWEDVQDDIQKAIDLIKEYLQKSGEASTASSQSTSSGDSSGNNSSGGSSSNGSSSGESSSPSGSGKTVTGTRTYTVSNGAQMTVTTYSDGSHTVTWGANSNLLSEKEKESIRKAYGFDTGGYTGSWGDSSGKLAMLHQKELVLNADDTSNFLSAISTIRDLNSSVGGSIQDAVLKAVANTALSLGTIKTNGVIGNIANNNSSTDNVFNITAEFPNANSVDDIREAILSLPNLASQYANSTLK